MAALSRLRAVTVNGSGPHQPPRLLNYLTHPNVLLWSACVASCAIPGIFAPVELMQIDQEGNVVPYYKEKARTTRLTEPGAKQLELLQMLWSDGSFAMDIPTERLKEIFNGEYAERALV